jgi:hypothetical protein
MAREFHPLIVGMSKLAYLECPTGLSGDMCLGALVHAGVPLDYLIEMLNRLAMHQEYKLWSELVHRNGQQATKVHVDLLQIEPQKMSKVAEGDRPSPAPHTHAHSHPHKEQKDGHAHAHLAEHAHRVRHLPEIEHLIQTAQLPARVEAWSLAVFRQLALAEGAVHGIAPEQVHFHEVGATDAIVDIVGTCLGLDWLGIDEIYCSALPTGGGTVRAAHGLLPVPAPAVLKLWEMRQIPVYDNGIQRELVTPTGAAIATTLATHFGAPPPMQLHQVGLGAGSQELVLPNILRLWVGTDTQSLPQQEMHPKAHMHQPDNLPADSGSSDIPQEAVAVLETQMDDINPQVIGYLFEVLLTAGALDVFTQAIGMKKSRPGILLTVICRPDQKADFETMLFRETTTLGIRHTLQQRSALHREIQTVQTEYGEIRVKVARLRVDGAIANVQPEYEDCAKLARQTHQPWHNIHRSALRQWHLQNPNTQWVMF